jgi:hypothetical protein
MYIYERLEEVLNSETEDEMNQLISNLYRNCAHKYYHDTDVKIGLGPLSTYDPFFFEAEMKRRNDEEREVEMNKPTNDFEALCLALELAVTAPNEEKSAQALTMAEDMQSRLTEIDVRRATKYVEEKLK